MGPIGINLLIVWPRLLRYYIMNNNVKMKIYYNQNYKNGMELNVKM